MARAGTPRLSGRRSAAAVLVALAGLARGVSAQGAPAVSGAVRDSATAEPVSMAELTLRDASGARLASTRSAPDGAYVLRVRRPGQYRVEVRHIGYARRVVGPLAVGPDGMVVDVLVSPVARALDPLAVAAPAPARGLLSGFEHRRKLKLGTFFTREDIERRPNATASDFLRMAGGVRVVGNGGRSTVIQMDRTASFHACQPVLYVDGMRMNRHDDPPERLQFVLEGLTAQTLEALEVYTGQAQVPGDFGGPDAVCGAIAAWTRTPAARARPDSAR